MRNDGLGAREDALTSASRIDDNHPVSYPFLAAGIVDCDTTRDQRSSPPLDRHGMWGWKALFLNETTVSSLCPRPPNGTATPSLLPGHPISMLRDGCPAWKCAIATGHWPDSVTFTQTTQGADNRTAHRHSVMRPEDGTRRPEPCLRRRAHATPTKGYQYVRTGALDGLRSVPLPWLGPNAWRWYFEPHIMGKFQYPQHYALEV